MTPLQLISAASLALTLTAPPVFAAEADTTLDAAVQQYRGLAQRGTWRNPYLPQTTGQALASESADRLLQVIVASYDRATLDRGGWHNAFVTGDHYAAGEPLLAAAVGSGVTSRGATMPIEDNRQLAAR